MTHGTGPRADARAVFRPAAERRERIARERRTIHGMGARNELRHLARRLANLSYEDRRRVIAEAQRLEHEHYARVRMLASEASDAEVRCGDKPTRERRPSVS